MSKARLEAFSDGVIAIAINIMVLELKVPHQADLASLRPLMPVFFSYALSFVFIGIYWNNHHHLLQAASRVNGAVLWANLHLLFWLSLIPFVSGYMGENPLHPLPVALYGVVLLMAGLAYFVLSRILVSHHGPDSTLARAVGTDVKGIVSLVLYVMAIALANSVPLISLGLYVVVAIMWLVPDRRIERALAT